MLGGIGAAICETAFDTVFLLELAARFFSCPNKIKFCMYYSNVVDLLAGGVLLLRISVGFNLDPLDSWDWRKLFLLCIVPTLRMMKTVRRFQKLHLIFIAADKALEALPVLMWFLVVTTLVCSTAIYLVEPRDNVESLPKAMWFVIVTLSTVGYGDVTPVTVWGSIVTTILIVASALYMSMPLGIVGQAFHETWEDRDRILVMNQTRKRLGQWGYHAEDIPIIFAIFDADGSGEIELHEFRIMITEMRIGLKDERIVQLFDAIDVDGGGAIDDKEFVRHIFPGSFMMLYEAAPPDRFESELSERDSSFRHSIASSHSRRGFQSHYSRASRHKSMFVPRGTATSQSPLRASSNGRSTTHGNGKPSMGAGPRKSLACQAMFDRWKSTEEKDFLTDAQRARVRSFLEHEEQRMQSVQVASPQPGSAKTSHMSVSNGVVPVEGASPKVQLLPASASANSLGVGSPKSSEVKVQGKVSPNPKKVHVAAH